MNFYQTPTPNTQHPIPNQIVGKSKNTESGKNKIERITSIIKDKPQDIQEAIDNYKVQVFSS